MPKMEGDGALRQEAYKHGMALDSLDERVQCNYCGTVVPGFDHLQLHLGKIKGNTLNCQGAPSNVKELFRSGIHIVEDRNLKHKDENFIKADCPTDPIPNSNGNSRKRVKDEGPQVDRPKDAKRVQSSCSGNITNSIASSSTLHDGSAAQKRFSVREYRQSSSLMTKRWIGRFLIENGIDFNATKSYSFRKMIEVVSNSSDCTCQFPSIQELKGWIFSDELKETKTHVQAIKASWPRTGCSIVLDGWVDGRGRNLLIVVVDCPLGAVYIQPFDISSLVDNVEGFILLLEGVLAEVGVQNVIQIIAHTASKFMNAVGEYLMEKHRSIFWTVSASHCVALMLEKIGLLSSVKEVLGKAKTVTKFIYSHADDLESVRSDTPRFDLVKPSKFKAAMPFLTLENILIEKENLEILVSSSEWKLSSWASKYEGKRVAALLNDKVFWDKITTVVRATIPLVKLIFLINGDGDPYVGFIYETMDQVKETIATELGEKEAKYRPYWGIIDDIWNNVLHSHNHAAGYFLNPRFMYDTDFCPDSEVAGGLLATIVKMVEDKHIQDLITKQIEIYRRCKGDFQRGTEKDKHISMPPAAWWSSFGGHCPELQDLAIRVLSQSCNGAEAYGLKKDMAEKLLNNNGKNHAEQQQLSDLAFMHYNMNLKQRKLVAKSDDESGDITSMEDWIV